MSAKQPEVFLAFKRVDDLRHPVGIEAAVSYDIPGEIDQSNNWLEPGEGDLDLEAELVKVAGNGVRTLLQFCFDGTPINKRGAGLKLARQRFVAVAHAIDPDALTNKGKPISLRKLGDMVGAEPRQLRRLAKQFMAQWGFAVRVQPIKTKRTSP